MKRIVFTLFFGLLAGSAIYADVIFYDTNGTVFNCSGGNVTGCGTNQVVLGGTLQLIYVPTTTSVTVDASNPTTNANFGYLKSSCLPNTACDLQALPQGFSLSINVNQTQPDPMAGAIPGGSIVGGGISGAGSSSIISWGPGGLIVFSGPTAQVTYSLANSTFGIVPPASCDANNTNCGQTTIQGTITDPPAVVPEPAISLLFAGGLVAIGAVRRRK